MRKAPNQSTFIACDAPYEDAELIIFGAPYDGTTSFRPGARFGPNAIRQESFGIETYSPYQDLDLADYPICDIGDLELPFGHSERALEMIADCSTEIFADNKKPLMLGGEHLVTLPAFQAALAKYPDLVVLHFDAHTDLRDDYLGEKLSHAAVIRRCWDSVGDARIFSFGIRSGDKVEWDWAKEHIFLCPLNFQRLEEALEIIGERPIYLTFDLDVLDPAELPGTGTQEAGGMHFNEIIDMLKKLPGDQIVAADINELAPGLDTSGRSTALAIKLVREFILLMLKDTKGHRYE